MRFFSFLFLFIFGLNAWAQSPVVTKLFSDGTRFANEQEFDRALKSYKTALFAAENEYLNDGYRARLHYSHRRLPFSTRSVRARCKRVQIRAAFEEGLHARSLRARHDKDATPGRKSASASFKDLLQADPKNGEAWFDLAFASIALNDLESAEEHSRRRSRSAASIRP